MAIASWADDAFRSLLDKTIDVGMSARRVTQAEALGLAADGAGDMFDPAQEHIVALDALVMIVHPDNPVQELNFQQLGMIYGGFIKNWSEVGGLDAPITLVERAESTGTRTELASTLAGQVLDQVPPVQPGAIIAGDNAEVAEIVTGDPNAIGYVGYAFRRGAKGLALINECGMRQIPDSFSSRTEEYALQRFLYLYNRADNVDEATNDLMSYAVSNAPESVGSFARNTDLSVGRAERIMDEVKQFAGNRLSGIQMSAEGYSEVAPAG